MRKNKQYFPKDGQEVKDALERELAAVGVNYEVSLGENAVNVWLRTRFHYKTALAQELVARIFPDGTPVPVTVGLSKNKLRKPVFPAAATHRKVS